MTTTTTTTTTTAESGAMMMDTADVDESLYSRQVSEGTGMGREKSRRKKKA